MPSYNIEERSQFVLQSIESLIPMREEVKLFEDLSLTRKKLKRSTHGHVHGHCNHTYKQREETWHSFKPYGMENFLEKIHKQEGEDAIEL